MFGKCKHPFDRLAVWKDPTVVPSPKYPKDYNHVTIHLFCQACGAGNLEKSGTDGALNIEYAQTIRSTEVIVAEMVEELKKEDAAK